MPRKLLRNIGLSVVFPLIVSLLHVGAAWAQCSERYPHEPAPSVLWGAIQPLDTGPLPTLGKDKRSTFWDGFRFADSNNPLWHDVDDLGGYLVTTMPYGLQIWNVGSGQSATMARLHDMSGWNGDFVSWPLPGEDDFFMERAGDTHDDGPTRSFFAQVGQLGMAIWSFNPQSPGTRPILHYQDVTDSQSSYLDIELLEVSGTIYAFVANGSSSRRVEVFDVTRASTFNRCLNEGGAHTSCPGVYQGSFSTGENTIQDVSGAGTFLATTHAGSDGTRLWDVSQSVTSPELRVEVDPNDNTKNSGLWPSSGGSYGLAVQTRDRLKVYEVSSACLNSGTCSGSNLQTRYNDLFEASLISVFSVGSRDLVYAADVSQCNGPDNKEELLDVTQLSAISAIMPRATSSFPEGGPVDYPGWYTPQSGVGFLWYQPHRMTGIGNTMYRAGWTSLDHHTLGQIDPEITVTGPAVSFRDQPARFTATASNCEPGSGTWSWSAGSGATIDLVGNGSAADITWSTLGQKTIRAMNTACEPNTVYNDATTDVQAPEALIVDIRLDGDAMGSLPQPIQRTVCDELNFSADVAGQLPLTYAWQVEDEQGVPISGAGSSSSSFTWDTSSRASDVPENISINLDLSNGVPSSDALAYDFDLLALDPIGFGGGVPQCSSNPSEPCGTVSGATVTAYANATGASDYRWEFRELPSGSWQVFRDFGAGNAMEDIPLSTGDWEIRVSLENCLDESAGPELLVDTSDGNTTFTVVAVPPNAAFAISTPFICPGGSNCNADVGQTVAFANSSSGDITSYSVDFDNTNASATSCTGQTFPASQTSFSFTYGFAGVYFPCLEAIGPGGSDVFIHQQLTISAAPATISVSCSPGSVPVGQSTTCTANASGCNPAPSGWTWNDSGGSGSSSSSQLTTAWSTAGSKFVTASNSQCSGAQGSRTVTVSDGGGGTFTAAFTVSPDPPGLNDTATFDSSPSTGEVARSWLITRGSETVHTANTITTQYTFSEAGTYVVELDVFNVQPCSSAGCARVATETYVIGSGGGPDLTADIQISPSDPEVGEQVTLDGRGSGPSVVEWVWTIQGPTGAPLTLQAEVVNIVFSMAGSYDVTLEVRDEEGCSEESCRDVATTSFEVSEPEVLAALFTVSPEDPVVGDFVTFDARPSTGDPSSYTWNINGQQFQGATIITQFVEFGDVEVMLTVAKGQETASTSRTIRVGLDCLEDLDTLCLGGRFRVTTTWQDFDANVGSGHVRSERTPDSGLFWFFAENNIELLVKVLDGCAVNDHFWVFAAGTTDVGYTLTVEDLLGQETWEFINVVGQASPAITETEALFTCDASESRPEPVQTQIVVPDTVPRSFAQVVDLVDRGEGPPIEGECSPRDDRFCFTNDRFQVEVTWESQTGESGVGMAGGLETPDSGVFYFFDRNNWELLVKVIDGCAITDSFWVFAAATTDQQFTLTVTDTVSGEVQQYFNPLGVRAPAITDTAAFPTCDQ